jgi:hypothetical protein
MEGFNMKYFTQITAHNFVLAPFPEPWDEDGHIPCITGWMVDNLPDVTSYMKLLRLNSDYSGMLAINIEEGHTRKWEAVDYSAKWLGEFVAGVQEAMPRARLGVYGSPFCYTWEWDYLDEFGGIKSLTPDILRARISAKQSRESEILSHLLGIVQVGFPSLYQRYPNQSPEWARRTIQRSRRFIPACVPYVSFFHRGEEPAGTLSQREWDDLINVLLEEKVPAAILWHYYEKIPTAANWFPLTTRTQVRSRFSKMVRKVFPGPKPLILPTE